MDKFKEDFYKDITKEQVISSLEHYQASDVKLSNEIYNLKEDIRKLIDWITKEIKDVNVAQNDRINENISLVYVGQKIAYTKILRELQGLVK